jgi:hypothetical protein
MKIDNNKVGTNPANDFSKMKERKQLITGMTREEKAARLDYLAEFISNSPNWKCDRVEGFPFLVHFKSRIFSL